MVLYLNSQKLSNRPMVRNLIQYSDHHLNTGQEKVQYSDVAIIQMFVIQIPSVPRERRGIRFWVAFLEPLGCLCLPLISPLIFLFPGKIPTKPHVYFKCSLYLYLIDPCVRGIGEQSRHWPRLGPSQGPQGKQVAIPTLSYNKFKLLDRLLNARIEIHQASNFIVSNSPHFQKKTLLEEETVTKLGEYHPKL